MVPKKILVTGCAGFIGMHFAKRLLKDRYEVIGVDNINDFYDINLKKKRLELLSKQKNFTFKKLDISNKNEIESIFDSFRPQRVVNLAAQAGVRYSIENPHEYINSNIYGFMNILDCCVKYKVGGLIYASSSSVYGQSKKKFFREDQLINNPNSIYAVSKISNELMAKSYSNLYGLKTTGLRYFSVYGPWGRPDMAMFIFTDKVVKGKPVSIFNYGDMKRDFTFIDDIVDGTISALNKNFFCEIFNLGTNKSERLMDVLKLIEKTMGKKAEINFLKNQLGDIPYTAADISHSCKKLGYNPQINIAEGIPKFTEWYLNMYGEK